MVRQASRTGSVEILDLIQQDHDKMREMFQRFDQAGDGRGNSIAQQIWSELELHSKLEEEIVYPKLKEQDEELFHESTEEHAQVDKLITEMKRMEPEGALFKARMKVLKDDVEHHMGEEETESFEKIGKLPRETLSKLARDWKSRKGRGA